MYGVAGVRYSRRVENKTIQRSTPSQLHRLAQQVRIVPRPACDKAVNGLGNPDIRTVLAKEVVLCSAEDDADVTGEVEVHSHREENRQRGAQKD